MAGQPNRKPAGYWTERPIVEVTTQARLDCLLVGFFAPVIPIGALIVNLFKSLGNGQHNISPLVISGITLTFESLVIAVGGFVIIAIWLLTFWIIFKTRESHPLACVLSGIGTPTILVSGANFLFF